METLSTSSLTTFQVPKPSKPNHHHHLKPPSHHNHNHPSTTTKSTITSSFSTLQQKDHFTPLNSYYYPKYPSSTFPPHLTHNSSNPRSSIHHSAAASGYAAALLELSQCNGTVLKVEKDVRRLLKVMRNGQVKEFMMDDLVKDFDKGKVIKELLERGKFDKYFVGLVKLIVDKGKKFDLVNEVLEEFLRVFSQLSVNVYVSQQPRLFMGST